MNFSRRKFIERLTLGAVATAVPMLHACRDSISSELATTAIPNPPINLQTTESLRYVKLTWNAPQTNIDGSPLTDLNSFQIYRRKLPESEFRLIFEVEAAGTIFIDANVDASEVIYRVVAKTRRGAASEPSEPSTIARAQMTIRDNELPLVGERRLYDASGARVQEPTSALLSIERFSENEFLVLELVCTHAGCGGMNFIACIWSCRCHGSRFDSHGNVIQPPATVPLTRLSAVRIHDVGLTVRA
jgi:Rieske Fe-S protein